MQINWKNLLFSIIKVLKREHGVSCLLSIYPVLNLDVALACYTISSNSPIQDLLPRYFFPLHPHLQKDFKDWKQEHRHFEVAHFAAEIIESIWKFFIS